MVANERGIPPYRVYADEEASKAVDRLRRQTLFMGLSDGARIDGLRHSNVGLLNNEQLVVSTQLDTEKWQDLLGNLEDSSAKGGEVPACLSSRRFHGAIRN